jgi:hypothetical protein
MRNRKRRRRVEDSIATHRLELVDRHGRTRIILACVEPPDGGPAIALFSEACEARAPRVDSDGHLVTERL